jgi:acyl-CoA synthetase (AMP-forming)/AMP-acid ligase II
MLITSLVPRHFDFLANLYEQSQLPLGKAELAAALAGTDILLGSAPVGAATVNNSLRFCKRLPHVRFGSTETCLEVMAIPVAMSQEETMAAFQAGWHHHCQGEKAPGFYIGRPHFPFTRVRVVKAVDPGQDGYMRPCESGQPGYLITQGANLMSGYVDQEEATSAVFQNQWYTGLRDIGFYLMASDGQLDYYWLGRDSALLIRGGANYAYEQVAADLAQALSEELHLPAEQFKLAVVGLNIESEHEDSCCVTIELDEKSVAREEDLARDFIAAATRTVPKGSRPDYVRFGKIPCSFKGAILYPQLKKEFREYLDSL